MADLRLRGSAETIFDLKTAECVYQDRTHDFRTFGQPTTLMPEMPETLNGYSYAVNNPAKYVDPSGKFIIVAFAIIALAAVAIGTYADIGANQQRINAWRLQGVPENRLPSAFGLSFSEATGASKIFAGATGQDPFTGRDLSRDERIFQGVIGVIEVAGLAFAALDVVRAGATALEVASLATRGAETIGEGVGLASRALWRQGARSLAEDAQAIRLLGSKIAGVGKAAANRIMEGVEGATSFARGLTERVGQRVGAARQYARDFAEGWSQASDGVYLGSGAGSLQGAIEKAGAARRFAKAAREARAVEEAIETGDGLASASRGLPEGYIGPERQLGPGRALEAFPEFRPGDPITKLTAEGEYPRWYSRVASEKASTVQGRYWMNRALQASPGEFTDIQLRAMRAGFAPQARVAVRTGTGEIEIRTVTKELHHNLGNRGIPGFDQPLHLREVWPWQHASIDRFRHTGYEFLRFIH